MDFRHEIEQLYLSAFPPEERRPLNKFWQNIDSGKVKCHVFAENNRFAGFLTIWDLGDFFYGEHFAICSELRSQGIGSKSFAKIVEELDKPFMFEVEPPTNALAQRRIGFYERLGCKMCNRMYIQPAYSSELKGLELRLMEHGENLLGTEFDKVVKTIHHNVYGIKITC